MIDTIKFKIPLTPLILRQMLENNTRRSYDPSSTLSVPPYNKTLTLFKPADYLYSKKKVKENPNMFFYLEGSLPKLEYGENIRLLYPQQLPSLFERIEEALINQYGDIPSWKLWEVQRLDVSYAWKMPNEEDPARVLRFMNTQEYPLKDKHWYKDETVTFGGRGFSISFYSKESEFIKKQYKKLIEAGFSKEAEEAKELSKGVLRYEIRIHKPKLIRLFGKNKIYTTDLLNLEFFYNILNACLTTALDSSNRNSISDQDAMEKLKDMHKTKAFRLFCFWRTHYLPEQHIKGLLKGYSNSTTIARNLKDISDAGVGIPNSSCVFPFDLSIPSMDVVTPPPPAPVALATEQGEKKKIVAVQEMLGLLFEKKWRG